MSDLNVIHNHKLQKEEPFWWVFYFLAMAFAMVLGLALMITPIALIVLFKSLWLFIFLIFVPFGFWIIKELYKAAKKLIWHNNHLSHFVLKGDGIHFTYWDEEKPVDAAEGTIPFSSIQYAVASFYVHRQAMERQAGQSAGGRIVREIKPVLFIVFYETIGRRLIKIPFYNQSEMTVWLKHLQENGVQLHFTDVILLNRYGRDTTDEERLNFIESNKESLLPFTLESQWGSQVPQLSREWNEKFIKNNPEANKEKKKRIFSFGHWFPRALNNYIFLICGIVLATLAVEKGFVHVNSTIPGIIYLFLLALMYFYSFKDRLHWLYMILFSVESIFACFLVYMTHLDEKSIAEEIASGVFLSSIIFIALVWFPYGIVKRIINRQNEASTERNLPY